MFDYSGLCFGNHFYLIFLGNTRLELMTKNRDEAGILEVGFHACKCYGSSYAFR